MKLTTHEKRADKISKQFNSNLDKVKRGIKYFKTLKEDVDFKKEKIKENTPLECCRIFPISEKGELYFKGVY